MRIEFQNSIARLSFLCCITDIKISWINPCITIFLFTKGLPKGIRICGTTEGDRGRF